MDIKINVKHKETIFFSDCIDIHIQCDIFYFSANYRCDHHKIDWARSSSSKNYDIEIALCDINSVDILPDEE